MDPRGFPTTLPEFQRVFPDEAACAKYLEHLRWPHGFTCTKCGNSGAPYRFAKRTSVVLRCRVCQANVSLMANTVMKDSHTPLSIWFWGAYLVATQTPGQSALQFTHQDTCREKQEAQESCLCRQIAAAPRARPWSQGTHGIRARERRPRSRCAHRRMEGLR